MDIPSRFQLREVGAQITLAEQPEDKRKARRFHMLAYSGAAMSTGFGNLIVDLAGIATPTKVGPVLRDHDLGKVVGQRDAFSNDGIRIEIDGAMSRVTVHSTEVAGLADEGFEWQSSLGLTAVKLEIVHDGESEEVNGRTFDGPGLVVKKSTLREVSFTPSGADSNTSAVVFSDGGTGSIHIEEAIQMATEKKTVEDPVEVFERDHAEQVKKYKEAGVQLERARVLELCGVASFADHSEFITEQIKLGATSVQARAEFCAVLHKDNQALTVKLTKAKAEAMTEGDSGADFVAEVSVGKWDTLTLADQATAIFKDDAEVRLQFGSAEHVERFLDQHAKGKHDGPIPFKVPDQFKEAK